MPRHLRPPLALVGWAVLLSCVGPGGTSPESPLERGRAALAAGQFVQARTAFEQSLARDSADPRARLGLGAALEGLDQLDSARIVYAALGSMRLPGRVRRQLDARVRLLVRRELELAARQAAAREAELAEQPPTPNTVAVFPFRFFGPDSSLRPLERGLAHLFITDLGHVRSLRLLEREQIQTLLNEIGLTESGRVDPATGARSGRLLRAAQVLQGTLQQQGGAERLRLDASMVDATSASIASTGSAEDFVRRIFDMEKEVVFQLLERLGVPLTPGERELLAERPTANLLAFLAFSRGLEAEDRGDFARAAREFRAAARLDPRFREASQRADAAATLSVTASMSPLQVSALLDPPALEAGVLAENLDRVMRAGGQATEPAAQPPGGRDQLGEVGGGDRITAPGGLAGLEVILRRP